MKEEKNDEKSTVTVDRSLLKEIQMRKYEKEYDSASDVLVNELQFLNEDR